MTAVEKIDWFCPKCNSYVSSESVTFEETHQICNTGVILKELNQNNMTAVEWFAKELYEKFEMKGDGKVFDELLDQSKEMEKEQKIEFACQVAESSAMKYIQGKTTKMIAEELLTFKSE